MKKKLVTLLVMGLGLLLMASIAHAATLDIRNGQLFGAADVDVNGALYDVAFRDGTCIELYGGADDNTDFPFINLSNLSDTSLGITANKALLDQVFVDSPLGAFDSVPNLTNGCFSPGGCYVYTPMRVNSIGRVGVVGVINKNHGVDIYTLQTSLQRTYDTGWWSGDLAKHDYAVYAVWGKTASVPIPGAVWLFGSGLTGLIGLRRKKK